MKTTSMLRHVRRSQASAALRRRASRSSASCRSRNGVVIESYAYDALGRRVATTTANDTERHVYDDNWQVIADLDANGNVLRSYVWDAGIDRLLAVKIGSRTYTAHTDVQGTVWAFSDEQENVAALFGYDAWGNVLSRTYAPGAEALAGVRYGFQGCEHSRLTGFIHFRMRRYDPVAGRWLSKDPIRLQGGMNLYAFCENSTLRWVDPDGLVVMIFVDPEPEHWGDSAPDWHRKDRHKRNRDLPIKPPKLGSGWIEMPPSQSIYHDNGKGKRERKFIHFDGREAVYDGDNEKLVTDRRFMGTYNYVNPRTERDPAWTWIWRGPGHFFADMLPYYIWGN